MRRVGVAGVCQHAVFLHQEIFEIVRWKVDEGQNSPGKPNSWKLKMMGEPNSFLLFLHFQVKHVCFFWGFFYMPRIWGENLLSYWARFSRGRRLFSRWELQILPRKAGKAAKWHDHDAAIFVCPPKNGGLKKLEFFIFRSGKPQIILGGLAKWQRVFQLQKNHGFSSGSDWPPSCLPGSIGQKATKFFPRCPGLKSQKNRMWRCVDLYT